IVCHHRSTQRRPPQDEPQPCQHRAPTSSLPTVARRHPRPAGLEHMEGDAMRFHVIRDPQARPAAYRELVRAAVRGRTATFGVLAACGLVITACGSQPSPGTASSATSSADTTTSPSSPSAVGACATAQLKISLTNTTALAGQAGGYLKFTNDGGNPCRMSGWPAVIGLKATGQATRLRHLQSSMFGAWHYNAPSPVITLQPGDSAYAIVAADDKPAGDN